MTISEEAKLAIETEEQILSEVSDSLELQLTQTTAKLSKESIRSRELTSELVAATRDEDKAMLASDEAVSYELSRRQHQEIKRLNKLIKKPYFARFVLAECDSLPSEQESAPAQSVPAREYEYKLGFAANPECRIVDWRKAPISKLFYEYHEGEEYSEEIQGHERNGIVKLRNSVEVEGRHLRRLSCRYGQFVHQDGAWQQVSGAQAAKARSGTASSYAELPNILSLITPEQFKLITEEAETALLIQGIAGSGKTTVALHRLAWLLHEDNSPYRPEQCLVIVLSRVLKLYLSGTLPSMGIQGVPILTYPEWMTENIGRALPQLLTEERQLRRPPDRCPSGIERLKRSMALLQVLEESQQADFRNSVRTLEGLLPWGELPSGLQRAFASATSGPPRVAALRLTLEEAVARGLEALKPENPCHAALLRCRQLLADFAKLQPDYLSQLSNLLTDPAPILAADETKLISKDLILAAQERSAENQRCGVLDSCDDALLLRLIQLNSGPGSSWQHIVVDEVQDLSPVDLAAVVGSVPHPSRLTLVGDVAQKIDSASTFPGWDKLRERWAFKDALSKFVSLTVSHRSTLAIMRLGDHIRKQQIVSTGRFGRPPIWFKCRDEQEGVRSVIRWLGIAQQRYPGSLTAVLCPGAHEAKHVLSLLEPNFGPVVRLGNQHSFSFSEGIVVSAVADVKGLEFQNVLIWNPNSTSYPPDQRGQNLLYVAVTRAEDNLCLVSWNRPSPHLPSIFSKLVRGVNYPEYD